MEWAVPAKAVASSYSVLIKKKPDPIFLGDWK